MKKLILLLVAVVLLGVLVIVYLPLTPNEQAPMVGNDRDTHGCIASAGYTYSVVRNACIRVWEEGVQLVPTVQIENPVLAAYAVQSEGGNQVEVFLPGTAAGVVLSRDQNIDIPTWAGDGWVLSYDPDQGWKLFQGDELLYTASVTSAGRDEHDCVNSDEYAFSVLKNKCVNLWENGFVLPKAGKQDDLFQAAHGIMSEDYKQIEIFLPKATSSFLLTRSGQEWKDEHNQWRLVRHPAKFGEQELWELFEKNVLRFESRPVVTVFLD